MGLAGWDEKEGTVDILFYILGTSTAKLSTLKVGQSVANIAGPLGKPTEIENFGRVICACGCFGVGPTLPLIKALKEKGNYVITVVERLHRAVHPPENRRSGAASLPDKGGVPEEAAAWFHVRAGRNPR